MIINNLYRYLACASPAIVQSIAFPGKITSLFGSFAWRVCRAEQCFRRNPRNLPRTNSTRISVLPPGCGPIYPQVASARSPFGISPGAKAPVVSGRTFAGTKNREFPQFEALSRTPLPRPPSSSRLVSPCCRAYPAGSGKPSIRRSMLPNKRRVRWLSASNSQ